MVGDRRRAYFWKGIWVGDKSLKDLCPRLFALAINKEGLVSETGMWEGDRWRWNIEWRRGRMGRERDEEEVLWEVLSRVQLRESLEDHWKWLYDFEERYVVKGAYEFLSPTECCWGVLVM
ncbi:hypothetical protein SLA2020_012310 [Shorea laevis]